MVYSTKTQSKGVRNLLSTALVFSSGVMLGERIKHFVATYDAPAPIERVQVKYKPEGAFINGQLYANGRLGEPRCDWNELAPQTREEMLASTFESEPGMLSAYLRRLPPERKEQVVYTTLVQLARERGSTPAKQADEVRKTAGSRWNNRYEPSGNLNGKDGLR